LNTLKKLTYPAALAAALLACATQAKADSKLDAARAVLQSTSPAQAVALYAPICAQSTDAERAAEYAYALAVAGYYDAAVTQMDRALIAAPLNADVRFFLSKLLSFAGLEDAAKEQHAAPPDWLKTQPASPGKLQTAPASGDMDAQLAYINALMEQQRYVQSTLMFARLCDANPKESQCWAGYALSLEKISACKSAAKAVERDIAASDSDEHCQLAAKYKAELEKQPPLVYGTVAKPALKGRYLAYVGGGLSSSGGETYYNLNGRIGKFLSERFDLSVTAGLNGGNSDSDYNGISYGFIGRYNVPLPFGLPLNGTIAASLQRTPQPSDSMALLFSPGLSYFMDNGSFDISWDWAATGSYKGSSTVSAGYTIYFGGSK